jgi:linoleate 8R-lipoxygenase/9,12-octadecadienoate 8-hydroperoxide 8R-isomerase
MAPPKFSSEPLSPTEIDILRGKVDDQFKRLALLISNARRPLPDQTGDGTYITYKDDSPDLLQTINSSLHDLADLGVTDLVTLIEVFEKAKTGALWDDKQYLMEKLIQTAAKFPDDSINGKKVTDTFLTTLYNDLQHPPIS